MTAAWVTLSGSAICRRTPESLGACRGSHTPDDAVQRPSAPAAVVTLLMMLSSVTERMAEVMTTRQSGHRSPPLARVSVRQPAQKVWPQPRVVALRNRSRQTGQRSSSDRGAAPAETADIPDAAPELIPDAAAALIPDAVEPAPDTDAAPAPDTDAAPELIPDAAAAPIPDAAPASDTDAAAAPITDAAAAIITDERGMAPFSSELRATLWLSLAWGQNRGK